MNDPQPDVDVGNETARVSLGLDPDALTPDGSMNDPQPDIDAGKAAARFSLGIDPDALTPDGSVRQHQELVQVLARQEVPDIAVEWALEGDHAAQQACLEVAAERISQGRALSGAFARYIGQFLASATKQQTRRRGRDPLANAGRDFRIALAVWVAADKGRLPPTRNEATETQSGCSVVAALLGAEFGLRLSEAAVAKIWRHYKYLR